MIRSVKGGVLTLAIVAACGSRDEEPSAARGEVAQAESVRLSSAPVRADLRSAAAAPDSACPATTLKGVDVSEYQAGYDFVAAKAAGNAFAFVRVSDGIRHPDSSFNGLYRDAKAAGLVRGAYQYFEPNQDPIAQADLLLEAIGGKLETGDLPPVIDLEASGVTASQAKVWLEHVEAALGVKPMIYVGYYFWIDNMANPTGFSGYPLWIAGYVNCPSIPAEWPQWTFWQYSDGTVNGTGGVDLNAFNGTMADLNALTAHQPDYAAHVVSQTYPSVDHGAIAVPLGTTVKGSITVKNVGRKTWKPGITKLAPMPRDVVCAMRAPTWLSAVRTSTVEREIVPGAEATFAWDVHGNAVGEFDEYFGFVEEGVTWFADGPLGGGPAENVIELRSHVALPHVDAPDAATPVAQVPTRPASSDGEREDSASTEGGCSVGKRGGSGSTFVAISMVSLLALVRDRRRRRASPRVSRKAVPALSVAALLLSLVGCAEGEGTNPAPNAQSNVASGIPTGAPTGAGANAPPVSPTDAGAPSKFFCPSGFDYSAATRMCVSANEALGPFTPSMVEACGRAGGGAPCAKERWQRGLAEALRGTDVCAAGSALDASSGYCVAGSDAYGPFLVTAVTRCKALGGGASCESMRWSLDLFREQPIDAGAKANPLDVPYFSQYDASVNPNGSCGNTSAAMVLAFWGKTDTPDEVRSSFNAGSTCGGGYHDWQCPEGLEGIYAAKGLAAHSKGGASRADIKRMIDEGRPVTVHANMTASGHIIVIVGYDDLLKEWVVNDPAGHWCGDGYSSCGGRGLRAQRIHYSYASLGPQVLGEDGNVYMSSADVVPFTL